MLHVTFDVQPVAVNVVLWPKHIVVGDAATTGLAGVLTTTVVFVVAAQFPVPHVTL